VPLPIIYVPRLRLSIWREEHFPAYLLLITYYLLLITYYLLLITYYLFFNWCNKQFKDPNPTVKKDAA
jgi:hypothetical protein